MKVATVVKRELFWTLPIGTIFRFIGGRERFIKVCEGWAVLEGKPDNTGGCHVPPTDTVIDLGWTNITPN